MPFCRRALGILLVVLLTGFAGAQTYTFAPTNTAYVSADVVLRRADGTFIVANIHQLVRIKGREWTSIAGSYSPGAVDGPGADARFDRIAGLAEDAKGNIYIADRGNHVIRRVDPSGTVTTFAGQLGAGEGAVDGAAAQARFNAPAGIVIDGAGAIYVADAGNHAIRRIDANRAVTTVAGVLGQAGAADGGRGVARFRSPLGLAVAGNGTLYVADAQNHAIRRVSAGGLVTTVAGRLGLPGFVDDLGLAARLWYPTALALTPAGDLFVLEPLDSRIRRITPEGRVTLIAANQRKESIVYDVTGNLYTAGDGIAVGTTSSAVAIQRGPIDRQVAAGSPLTLTATATGLAPLRYQWQKDGVALAGATSSRYHVASAQASDAGAYTVSVANDVGVVLSSVARITIVAPHPHDAFASAARLAGVSGTFDGITTGATAEDGEPQSGSIHSALTAGSVWHRWTAPATGRVVFTDKRSSWRQPAVYAGPALTELQVVSANGAFNAVAGREYLIRMGSEDMTGAYALTWVMVANDDFERAHAITTDSGQHAVPTHGLSLEPGEPVHAHRSSQQNFSLWYTWTTPKAGIVQIGASEFVSGIFPYTAGIDVYTGSELGALTPIATRRAGNGVAFVAAAGTTYKVAVSVTGGPLSTLSVWWSLTTSPVVLGVTVTPARVYRLRAGTPVTLEVEALSLDTPRYQWRREGIPLAGATARTLTFAALTVADAGKYDVDVSDANGSAETSRAEFLYVVTPPANDDFASAALLGGASGWVTGTNVDASGEPDEPLHWSYYGNQASLWYRWIPSASGRAAIDTVGSKIDTVLAVYTGNSPGTLTRLVQDDDSGGNRASHVAFSAKAGTEYWIAVGGATSQAQGEVRLNWQLDPVLSIVRAPSPQSVAVGGSAQFAVEATGAGATYQWYRNGVALPGETRSTLTVTNVAPGDDATYTVSVTNSTGTLTSAPATLAVTAPQLANLTVRSALPGGEMLWGIASSAARLVAVGERGLILTSTDGQTWLPQTSGVTGWLVGVAYGAGRFVAVGEGGTILVSTDGVQWRPALASGTVERLNNVIYARGRFVAVGEHGTILTSDDASLWTPRESGVSGWLRGLAYNPTIGHFAATGQNGAFVVSADGNVWSAVALGEGVGDIEALAEVASYADFVAVGATGTVLAVRQNQLVLKDGGTLTTWTADRSAPASSVRYRGVATGANALFASGEEGKVITASDAAGPWVTLPSGTDVNLVAGTYFQHRLYLVGQNRTVLESEPLYASRLVNLSTRAMAGPDAATLISGFVVTGTAPKKMLIRAAGPSLGAAPFHLPGVLTRPQLTLYNREGAPVATNAGWESSPEAAAMAKTASEIGAFPFQAGSADAAILITLEPGTYTAHTSGVGGTSGLTIVEVYDADPLSIETSRAINLSTRGVVGTGANKLILGFVINGASSKRVLIRAAGPALGAAPFHLPGTLARPQLELYNSRGLLRATAGEWGLQPNADEIRGVAKSLGAFALPDGSGDSAMLVTLLPGAWTVQVGGADGTSGLAIAEVYVLP